MYAVWLIAMGVVRCASTLQVCLSPSCTWAASGLSTLLCGGEMAVPQHASHPNTAFHGAIATCSRLRVLKDALSRVYHSRNI